MQYSLLSRFQGALLGAVLGDRLRSCCTGVSANSMPLWIEVEQWGMGQSKLNTSPCGWGRTLVHYANQLIQGDWEEERDLAIGVMPNFAQGWIGIAIALIPIVLCFHDDLDKLRYQIEQNIAVCLPACKSNPEFVNTLLVFACAITLALQQRLQPATLIPRLITDLELESDSPLLTQRLRQVQDLVAQDAPLGVMRRVCNHGALPDQGDQGDNYNSEVSMGAIAVTFYSFLGTPEDFRLALLRTARLNYQAEVTCVLVGTLSGVYNSMMSIPLGWRRQLTQASSFLNQHWGIESEVALLRLADQLLAVWSGIYNPTIQLEQDLAVAAPYIIRC
jgi:ADP-ribosylglycohydrolase